MKESLGSFGRSNEVFENEEFQANRTRAQDPDWVKYRIFVFSVEKIYNKPFLISSYMKKRNNDIFLSFERLFYFIFQSNFFGKILGLGFFIIL